MQDSQQQYECVYTYDMKKKKKKWIDGKIFINLKTRMLKVSPQESESKSSNSLYSGIVDQSKLANILAEEEVHIGNILLVAVNTDSSEVLGSKRTLENSSPLPSTKKFIHKSLLAVPKKNFLIVSKRVDSVPNPLEKIASFNSGNLCNTASLAINATENKWALPHLIKFYGLLSRTCLIDQQFLFKELSIDEMFQSVKNYSLQISNALCEEISLNMASSIKIIENKANQALSDPKQTILKSAEITLNRLRSFGMPIISNVEVIISPPKDDDDDNNNSYIRKKSKFNHRRHSKEEEEEEDAATAGPPLGSLPYTSIYLKVGVPASAELPRGCLEAFGRDDIWALWQLDSPVSPVSSSLLLQDQLQELHDRYLAARRNQRYPLPWFGGVVWQPVHLLRAVWHGFTAQGMLAVTFLDGGTAIPATMDTKLAAGHKSSSRGSLSKKFMALRISQEMTNLASLDGLASLRAACTASTSRAVSSPGANDDRALRLLRSPVLPTLLGRAAAAAPLAVLADETVISHCDDIILHFGLNSDQQQVVRRVGAWFRSGRDAAGPVVLVHGVFGSGKSHLLAAVCLLLSTLLRLGGVEQRRIMLAANTNVAVDRVLLQLTQPPPPTWSPLNIVRIGRSEKVHPALRQFVAGRSGGKDGQLAQGSSRVEAADVIGVTCASSVLPLLSSLGCGALLLDEASQMTEPTSLLPLLAASPLRLLLVGDPQQLPPATADGDRRSCTQPATEDRSLNRTLFDRLCGLGTQPHMLAEQYRCHPAIAQLCSELFYAGRLRHGVSAEDRPSLAQGLPAVATLDCAGGEVRCGDSSYTNASEAALLLDLVRRLAAALPVAATIGVVCMYKGQANLVQRRLEGEQIAARVQVSTVDAFQGCEKDVIIIALTRSSAAGGFLSNRCRVNVAISRAKHHLIVVGNASVLSTAELWKDVARAGARFADLDHLTRTFA